MDNQQLLLDRVEFTSIHIEHNRGKFQSSSTFPQLDIDDDKVQYLNRAELYYPDERAQDPRYFGLMFGIKVESESAEEPVAPYDIEVEVMGYFRYQGDTFVGEERFKCIRFSGYQILYGAIREMVSNLTARGRHGAWHLPARDLRGMAFAHAKEDEIERQNRMARLGFIDNIPEKAKARAPRGKKPSAVAATTKAAPSKRRRSDAP